MYKNIRNISIIIGVASVALISLYFIFFHGNFSDDSNSWSNFGNYYNGVLTPLLTALNIYVFYILTKTISEIEESRRNRELSQEQQYLEKELEQAKKRFDEERKHEKELILLQLRKQELDMFIKQVNKMFDYNSKSDHINSLQQVADYLRSFSETGLKWFDINDNGKTKNEINILWVKLNKYIYNLQDGKVIEDNVFNAIYDSRANISNTLFEATLKNNQPSKWNTE